MFPCNVLFFPFSALTGSCHYLFHGNVLIFPFNVQTGGCHYLFPGNVLTYPFNTETHSSTRNVFSLCLLWYFVLLSLQRSGQQLPLCVLRGTLGVRLERQGRHEGRPQLGSGWLADRNSQHLHRPQQTFLHRTRVSVPSRLAHECVSLPLHQGRRSSLSRSLQFGFIHVRVGPDQKLLALSLLTFYCLVARMLKRKQNVCFVNSPMRRLLLSCSNLLDTITTLYYWNPRRQSADDGVASNLVFYAQSTSTVRLYQGNRSGE